ncbi:hypothetical protein SETIT_7G001000v2 [Setaria italica]|uniref:Uncharacterized protein n=1 Tax=Setaria italica TaxID=4555 RepID=A0A368RS79_SETIT|nr:hypothetical protein SETIT_7G000100v2 [Setaria italica]RCV32408.1 hypothetical protein SETIT_7G000200v2 [Setaria italica]RCV32409.1 hypothetical protein SETIT_7G000300v2 [Setaria italica]RCV32410.1 hypothetical protein SETIT_7G000400v2 [Setaria italica]RCV32411.1 hypothetical protein SETIT_7G000500v2 [Setaria italica]
MKNVAKCDTWCELQNPANHRVFERKLRPRPSDTPNPNLGKDVVFGSPCCKARWAEVWAAGITCRAPHVVGDIYGGEETYKDSPSNGERTGNSPA